eukprot:Sspe_Gene.103474::Locus_79295_Transcript_1_1_Confidence_1.000_Length_756::g.103474::m.103474
METSVIYALAGVLGVLVGAGVGYAAYRLCKRPDEQKGDGEKAVGLLEDGHRGHEHPSVERTVGETASPQVPDAQERRVDVAQPHDPLPVHQVSEDSITHLRKRALGAFAHLPIELTPAIVTDSRGATRGRSEVTTDPQLRSLFLCTYEARPDLALGYGERPEGKQMDLPYDPVRNDPPADFAQYHRVYPFGAKGGEYQAVLPPLLGPFSHFTEEPSPLLSGEMET